MAKLSTAAFDRDFENDIEDPEFRDAYLAARARIDAIGSVITELDAVRERQGLTKAELARRVGVSDAVIRRLFSAEERNPTMKTIVAVAAALGLELKVRRSTVPRASRPT